MVRIWALGTEVEFFLDQTSLYKILWGTTEGDHSGLKMEKWCNKN